MKDNYNTSISLLCPRCGSNDFNFNDDRSKATCNSCTQLFPGGYNEIFEANSSRIEREKERVTNEVVKDVQEDLNKSLKQIFKNSKFIKIK